MIGKITSIVRQKKDKERASLFVEEVFAFGVNEQTIEEFRLRKGDYIDEELHDKIIDFDYWISAKRIAMSYVNRRARSEKEIRVRLVKEEIPDSIIERVMEFLRDYNLVDDAAWAKAYLHDRLMRKKISAKQLGYELTQKGIGKEVIEQTLATLTVDESDEDRALAAAMKRWPRLEREEPRKRKQKLYAFLASRGFSSNLIAKIHTKLTGEDVDED
ncbi:MAG: RecX family transcriptional regulator [Candidatus Kapaibacterium sp.]|jgi:regulatory protein